MWHQIKFHFTILQHLKIQNFVMLHWYFFVVTYLGVLPFPNPCIVRCYIGKIWQVFGSGPALRLKKWLVRCLHIRSRVYCTVTTAVFIDRTHVKIPFLDSIVWRKWVHMMDQVGLTFFDLRARGKIGCGVQVLVNAIGYWHFVRMHGLNQQTCWTSNSFDGSN